MIIRGEAPARCIACLGILWSWQRPGVGVAVCTTTIATSAAARGTLCCYCFCCGFLSSQAQKNRLYVSSCSHVSQGKYWWLSTGSTCTPWSRRLSTGDVATRARGSRRYQLLSWYRPYMILLLLSCLLCCVVRDRMERGFMRADGDYRFCRVCLTNHGRHSRLGEM